MSAPLNCKILTGMAEALCDVGVSPREVLTTAGLPPHLFELDERYVSLSQYFAFWKAIRTVSGNPNIGLELATHVKPDLTEPFFLAVISALDVAAALEITATYKRTLSPAYAFVTKADETVSYTVGWPDSETPLPQTLADSVFSFVVEMCRRGTRIANLSPVEVHFRSRGVEDGSRHESYFGCPVYLGAAENTIVYDREDAARPFVTYNPQLLEALVPYLKAHTPPPDGKSPIALVRSVIAERVRGQRPTLRMIGKELAMSGRALQRLLQEHGTTFRQILDEVRNEHAMAYLSSTSFSSAEVAFLLGFDDANSFYRAFRAWNGITPAEFRRNTSPN